MPYTQALRDSFILIKEQSSSWLIIGIITFTFAFFICPEDKSIQGIISKVNQSRDEVIGLVKKTEHLQSMLRLVENRDPFTMERLIREEFRLKRIKPSSENQ